jgi:hypothetical protein
MLPLIFVSTLRISENGPVFFFLRSDRIKSISRADLRTAFWLCEIMSSSSTSAAISTVPQMNTAFSGVILRYMSPGASRVGMNLPERLWKKPFECPRHTVDGCSNRWAASAWTSHRSHRNDGISDCRPPSRLFSAFEQPFGADFWIPNARLEHSAAFRLR